MPNTTAGSHPTEVRDQDGPWETGALGRDPAYVKVAGTRSADLDDALGLQMISIRLEKGLLRDLKEIAAAHGIGYQPMIRDLLNRFAKAEIKSILEARLSDLAEAERSTPEEPGPVTRFLSNRRAAG